MGAEATGVLEAQEELEKIFPGRYPRPKTLTQTS